MRKHVWSILLLVLLMPLSARAQTRINYTVSVTDPISHLFDVTIDVAGLRSSTLDVAMPAWTPGLYLIRDFARNVQAFQASTNKDRPLAAEQLDKQTWRITKQAQDDVQIRYQVFSTDLTDAFGEVAMPAGLFMYVVGQQERPVSVNYRLPARWNAYTALIKQGDHFEADSYASLIDSPVMIGPIKPIEFKSTGGIPMRIVINDPDISWIEQQVTSDLTDLLDAAIESFGNAPFKTYTLFIRVQNTTGAGGMAHLASSRIVVGENDFVAQGAYQRFLSIAARTFVQAWNRPAPIANLSQEIYSKDLWFTEGVSAYLGDHLMLQAGLATPQEFYAGLSNLLNSLQHSTGRKLMSLEDASINTWTRGDNAINNSVSYYTKGEVVGLLLDLDIRARTKSAKSLRDVIRDGSASDDLRRRIEKIAGSDFEEFFSQNVRGRDELNYARYLGLAGIAVDVAKQPASIYIGVDVDRSDNNLVRIRRVSPGSPAEKARLDAGDILLALDGRRLTVDNFTSRIHEHLPGRKVQFSVMRGERLLSIDLTPVNFQDETWSIYDNPKATPEQVALRKAWLGANP